MKYKHLRPSPFGQCLNKTLVVQAYYPSVVYLTKDEIPVDQNLPGSYKLPLKKNEKKKIQSNLYNNI